MDLLSHVFMPLTAVYVLRQEVFDQPWILGLGIFGLLPDFDKFLWMPGLLHSLLTLVPLSLGLVGAEYLIRKRVQYSSLAVALIASHLVLDFIDGGPVPLLFPLIKTGIGLTYPAHTVFLSHFPWIAIEGPVTIPRTATPRPDNHTYGFLRGAGVASMLLFLTVYLGVEQRNDTAAERESDTHKPTTK